MGVTIDSDDSGVAHCFRCGHIEHYREARREIHRIGAPRPPMATKQHATLSEYWRGVWDACKPIAGDPRAYLEVRHCLLPPVDGDLRCHYALKHPSGHIGPALVALVTDIITREPISLHRTWIQADGTKAACDTPRMLLGGHRKAGGVLRLWPDDAVTTGLAIAEGIETALSIAHGFTPVWSVLDAGNMATFPVLDGIDCLIIAADNDPAGISAANTCATGWASAGRDVRIVMPPEAKTDLNDLVRAA